MDVQTNPGNSISQQGAGAEAVPARQSFFSRSWRRFTIQHGISCRASLAQGQAACSCIHWIQWQCGKSFYYLRALSISFFPVATRNWYPCSLGCSTQAGRETGSVRPFYWFMFSSLYVFFQLYHADSFVSPLIFKLKYSGQEQSEFCRHWWSNEKSTHKLRRLFTQNGKNRNQIWGLTCAIAGIGTACIVSKASEPRGGVAKQSDISSQYF